MNNFMIGLKRFFTNKNVVTIILVLVILVALYWGYSSSIKQQTNPVSVPVAAKTIGPQTEITSGDITYIQVANSMISDNVQLYSGNIIGKYTTVNVTIPTGSMFYNEWLANAEDVPGNWIEQLDHEKGELGYYLSTDIVQTLGNNVVPNSYIDIYMKATDENGTVMFGRFMKNVKVLVVHDASGNNVFISSTEKGTPAKIGFAVTQEQYLLLKKAEYLNQISFVIAPRGVTVPTLDYLIVTSEQLKTYITSKTVEVVEDVIPEELPQDNVEVDGETNTENQNGESSEVTE